MDRERWEQVKTIFDAALRCAPNERERFLADNCQGEEELRVEVESLLASFDGASNFLQKPAVGNMSDRVFGKSQQIAAGERIAHYEIIEQIGAGGMGEVYLAEDTRLNRRIALKLLASHFTEDETRVSRFQQEAFATSALNHPNIVSIYEIGKWDERDFIVTEFIEGVTLRNLLGRKKLTLGEAIEIALQTAGALAAAHGAGVVHRDIKPENIVIRTDGLVKVLDFGIAKYRPIKAGHKALVETADGEIIGTAAYMSPEQARGLEVDARTDIWSLGVMLYEMIARKLPFDGETRSDRVAGILLHEPEPFAKSRRNIPLELQRIVDRSLAKEIKKRYGKIDEMAEDLYRLREATGEKHRAPYVLPGQKSASSRSMLAALAAVLLIVGIIGFGYYFWLAKRAATANKTSIAVLPFINESGKTEVEYLSDGISESLINNLSQLKQLKVVARATAFSYKNRQSDPRQIGRELGVETILTGKTTLLEDTLIVQTDLINVEDGAQIWGERYTRKLADLLSVQESISSQIFVKLQPKLNSEVNSRLTKLNPDSSKAYQLYLKGRFFWNRRTEADIRKAIEYFDQAISEDPEYTLAYVGLADSFNVMGFYNMLSPGESFPKAKIAAEKALKLNGDLAEAYSSLAYVALYYDWDFAVAEKGFIRAIELKPNYPVAHQWYGNLLTAAGKWDEAAREFAQAQELDPLSPIITAVPAWTYIYARQYDRAIEPCRKALDLDPNFALAHNWLGQAYERKGNYEKAIIEFNKALSLSEESSETKALLAHVHAVSGNKRQARNILNELTEQSKYRYVSPYHIATIYAGLGDQDRALKWLDEAYQDRQNNLIFLNYDARMDDLRSNPRFLELLKKVGFP